jgi:lipopolysaccharide transport system permease protein
MTVSRTRRNPPLLHSCILALTRKPSPLLLLPTRLQESTLPETFRIEPPRSWKALNVAELWRFRELLYFLIWRDIKVRYKQTVLGAMWAVLQPAATTLMFTIFFGNLGGMSRQVAGSYTLFVYVAMQPWTFFGNAVSLAANSLVGSSHLISKVYFPRLLVPIAAIGSGLLDFAVGFALTLALMVYYHVHPTPAILLVPLLLAATLVVAAGAGVLLAALIVAYRDFRYVVTFLVQLWFFATPVAYPLGMIPEKWRLLYSLNPMAGIVTGFRAAILGTEFPLQAVLISILSAMVLLVIGVSYFLRVERRFADII